MTDNATRALEILNQLGELIDYLRTHPNDAEKTGMDGIRNTVETAHGAATVHALLAIADAIRDSNQCRSELHPGSPCIRPTKHDGYHRGRAGNVW